MIIRTFFIAFIGIPFTSAETQKPLSVVELQQYLAGVFSDRPESRRCPAPPPLTPQGHRSTQGEPPTCALAPPCQAHSRCPAGQACCFNGCLFTCVEASEPPPVIDWEVEPSLERTGLMNLTAAEVYYVPVCTTTFQHAPSLPTACPRGFTCQVQDPGDPLLGIPNKGICVPSPLHDATPGLSEKNVEEDKTEPRERIGIESVFLPGGCILSKEQYNIIQEFVHRSYVLNCTCIESSIECQLSSTYNKNIGKGLGNHKF